MTSCWQLRKKTDPDNSIIGDGKQILNTAENSNSKITQQSSTKMHRDGKSVSKNSSYNKKLHISTWF